MKKAIFLLICLTCFGASSAQTDTLRNRDNRNYKWSMTLAGAYHEFFKLSHPFWDFPFSVSPFNLNYADQWEARLNYSVSKKIKLGIGYATWNTVPSLTTRTYPTGQEIPGSPSTDSLKKGLLQTRRAYKMVDIYGVYTIIRTNRAEVDLGIGISRAWGINNYVDTLYRYLHDTFVEGHDQIDHYWGIVPMASYNFFLWRGRLAIGCDLKWRRYFGFYSSQIDYGYHISINF